MNEGQWFFGLVREGGCYRIAAAGPSEARVRRALAEVTVPTMIATREELPALGVPESETRRWLPQPAEQPQPAHRS